MTKQKTTHAMRLLYKHCNEGVWMSKNGNRAFNRGEKPAFMWPDGTPLIPTTTHHIARKIPTVQVDYTRELLMFYRKGKGTKTRAQATRYEKGTNNE